MNNALQEAMAQALWCDSQPRPQPRARARDAQDEQRRARARADEAEYVRGRAQRLLDHRLSLDSATAAARIRAAAAKQKPDAYPVPQHRATAKRTLHRAAARPPKAEREMAAQEAAARRRVEVQERQVERQELLAQRQLVLKQLQAERKGKQAERKRKHEALMLERAAQANADAEAKRKAQREREAEAQREAERKAQRKEAQLDPLCRGPDGNGNCRHQGIRRFHSDNYRHKLCKGCDKDELARLDRPCPGWQAGGCRHHNQARPHGTLCQACNSAQMRSRKKSKQ